MTSRNGSSIGYTSYNLPSVINGGSGTSSSLSYGAFRNRYKQVAVTPSGTETTIYVAGLVEKVTRGSQIEYRHYIAGGKGTAAIHTRVAGGASSTYYLHRDHLGSSELITDSSGNAVVRPSFAAYGERRDGNDWSGPPSASDLTNIANITRRGFTGHEHLDSVGRIHMNGRVFEPVAGRFLSRDPFIDGFASSQGMNGYAYVHNSPLTFVDPSGFNCEPPEGMSDEEAAAYISTCNAAFESSGWGPVGEGNSRYCSLLGMGCPRDALGQYTESFFAPISPDVYRALARHEQMVSQTIRIARHGSGPDIRYGDIVVTANRLTGEEWITTSGMLPPSSRGMAQIIAAGENDGTLPMRTDSRVTGSQMLAGAVATGTAGYSMIDLSRAVESFDGMSALRGLARIGPVLSIGGALVSWSQGDYVDALISGGLGIAGGVAIFVGSAPVAGAIGVISIGYVIGRMAFADDGQ